MALIVEVPAFVVTGRAIIHEPGTPDIVTLWQGFQRIGEADAVEYGVAYGVMRVRDAKLHYLAGQRVATDGPSAAGTDRWLVTAGRFLKNSATLATVEDVIHRARSHDLAAAGLQQSADALSFERYPSGFDPTNPAATFDIFIQVR